jgi:hypothetical protein
MTQPAPSPILQAAALFRAELERGDAQALGRLIDAYRRAYRRLSAQVDALLLETAEQGLTRGQLMRLDRYRDLMGQVADELQGFHSLTVNEAEIAAQNGIVLGERHGRALVSVGISGGPELAGALQRLPTGAVEQLLGFLRPDGPLYAQLRLLAPYTASLVSDAIVSGVVLGYNPRKIAGIVQDAFGHGLTDALRTVRTVQLYSYREATRASYVANQDVVQGWVWHAHLGPRTCASCFAQHGTFHTLDETLNDHHSGRCAMLPAVRERELPLQPGDGEKWFREQPEAFQRQTLGKGKYEAWKRGDFEFSQLSKVHTDHVYGPMWVETPLKELIATGTTQ